MYNPVTYEKLDGANFMECDLFWDYQRHIDRLPDTEDDRIFNPVFTSENREVGAINSHYTFWRNTDIIPVESVDSLDRNNLCWTSHMSKFVLRRTKLETVLNIALGMTVSFTSNDVDENAANNSRGTIIEIICVEGVVEHIIVAPFLTKSDLTPHPIKVGRKIRILTYMDRTVGVVQLTRSQFPLRSADASTINTVQGSSVTEPHIVNSQRNSNRGFGRMYVACSRAVDDDIVFILFAITPADVIACPIALAFDMHHRPGLNVPPGLTPVDYSLLILNEGKYCQIVPRNV
jgi:hypothetical protein